MRALIAGWFSFENSDFTAGDLLACDLVGEWLEAAGFSCDVSVVAPLSGGVDLSEVDPKQYSHAVFVCGPFMKNALEARFLGEFADCAVIGVNLSLPVPLSDWNPFDLLVERDSSRRAHPDITFLSNQARVPVVGVCLVEPYGGAIVEVAKAAIDQLISSREMAVVRIDTRLDINSTGLRTKSEIESLLARMDAVVTTRLHGTVLALKNGVPALVIDPEPGGARIRRQAETIGWPAVFTVDALETRSLQRALDYCLTQEARAKASECSERAIAILASVREGFINDVKGIRAPGAGRRNRKEFAIEHGWTPSDSA